MDPARPRPPSAADGLAPPTRWHGERFNVATHLAALALFSLCGMGLILRTVAGGDASKLLGAAVFVLATMVLYAASVLCHSVSEGSRQLWQRVDHAAIFLLIAGTSTPFALLGADHPWQWIASAGVWSLAGRGMLREALARTPDTPDVRSYLLTGWLALLTALPVAWMRSDVVLAWLVAGGLCYSCGTFYYRNAEGCAHAHGIWHLFVAGGTACHFMAIALLLA